MRCRGVRPPLRDLIRSYALCRFASNTMKVTRQESVTQPYVLGARDLELFITRAQNWLTTFKFEVNCKDKLKREFSTLAELLQFKNAPTKDIRALRIFGMSKDTQTHLWLKF